MQMRLLVFVILLVSITGCSKQSDEYPAPPVSGQYVLIDPTALIPEMPAHFSYTHKGQTVNFFLVKTHDRVISFFDACKTCYPKKMGYKLEKGSVTCRACGEKYAVSEIENGVASCFPVKLPGQMQKDMYGIAVSELKKGMHMF